MEKKNIFQKIWQSEFRLVFMVMAIAAFAAGYFLRGGGSAPEDESIGHQHEANVEAWTCSMHPQIRQPQSGACPICGMDLIPVTKDSGDDILGPRQLKLSPAAVKLAEIQLAQVERKYVATEIRMVGKVEYDETRLSYISARVPGRIDRLYVDFTGTRVRENDHLVNLYSPQLISAQQELLEALNTFQKLQNSQNPDTREKGGRLLDAVRQKLYLWGLTEAQVSRIESERTVTDHLTIYSPIQGVVIHRNATEGMYVETGTEIYTIADLSHVWVKLDAYESDLEWLRFGETVEFRTEAYSGEVFAGRIAFIDPVLNPKTRTVKVRVNVENRDGKLKPEMFVRAVVRSSLSTSGKVMDKSLAGKWISPMHPEIVKSGPGNCDICGMKLVRAEELGYLPASKIQKEAPLVIPASAPLITGKRAVVYVAIAGKDGVFEGREIELGPRAGDFYLVNSGLQEGERVVTNGNFKLDSDLQIRARPSMMNPAAGGQTTGHHDHGDHSADDHMTSLSSEMQNAASALLARYFEIQQALSRDNLKEAKTYAETFQKHRSDAAFDQLTGSGRTQWVGIEKELRQGVSGLLAAAAIDKARAHFSDVSLAMYQLLKQFDVPHEGKIYRILCPMAFDNQGGYWLQPSRAVKNPYWGAEMLSCGEIVETL